VSSWRADYIHTSPADTACPPARARKSHAGICMKRNDFRKCENELGGSPTDYPALTDVRVYSGVRGQRDSFIAWNITWRRGGN